MPTGLGDEQLWISATNDDTGTSSALNDLSAASRLQYTGSGVTVTADTDEGGTYALSFDGSSTKAWQYNPSLQSNGGYFGWSAWFQADAIGSTMSIAGGNSWSSQEGGWMGIDSSGFPRLILLKGTSGTPNVDVAGSTAVNAGQWYHIAASGDGTTARLYLDGVEVGSGLFTGFAAPWTRFVRLGSAGAGAADAGFGTNTLFFDGLIDDARFYDRTLTKAEITHLSSQRGVEDPAPVGLGGEQTWICPSISIGYSDGAIDLSGNNNHAIYQGIATTTPDTSSGGSEAFFFDQWGDSLIIDQFGGLLSQSRTVSYWIKRVGVGQFTEVGCTSVNFFGGSNNRWLLQSGGNSYALWSSSNNNAVVSGPTYDSWEHVVIVRDDGNGNALIYKNGTITDTIVPTNIYNAETNPSDFFIGMLSQSGTSATDIYVDDVRTYGRVLTEIEISYLSASRGITGAAPVGLGDEKLWLCPTLNENLSDLSIYKRSTTFNNATIVDDSNLGGVKAYSFDGSSKYIRYYDNGIGGSGGWADFIGGNNWTVSLYLKLNSAAGNSRDNFLGNRKKSGYYGRSFHSMEENPLDYGFKDILGNGSVNKNYDGDPTVDTDWHHIVFRSDDRVVSLYVDGVKSTKENTATQLAVEQMTSMYIGRGGGGNTWYYLDGLIDDVRLYDRPLEPTEITHLSLERGIEGSPILPRGLGDEIMWLCPSLQNSPGDLSGNGNHGTYINGLGTIADNENGGSFAFRFDGINDYLQTTLTDTDWRPNNGNFSVCGWYKTDSKYQTGMLFNDGAVQLGQESNFNRFRTMGTLPADFTNWAEPLYANSNWPWRHFVCIYKDGVRTVYQNGILVVTDSNTGLDDTINAQSYDARIGWDGGTNFANAYMDDIRVYNRALKLNEIKHLSSNRGVLGVSKEEDDGLRWYESRWYDLRWYHSRGRWYKS